MVANKIVAFLGSVRIAYTDRGVFCLFVFYLSQEAQGLCDSSEIPSTIQTLLPWRQTFTLILVAHNMAAASLKGILVLGKEEEEE